MTFENYTNYLKIIPNLRFVPVDNETWDTICSEGLDEEQDSPNRKDWRMAILPISKEHSEEIKNFNDEAIDGFNAFDIMLKDVYQGKLVDFIDYDNGIVKIVKSEKPITEYSFIKNLCESKLIRGSHSYKNYSARDIADLIFLNFLGLQILRSEFDTAAFAATYARKTVMWNGIDNFRGASNDLYMLMFCLFGKNNESAVKILKKQEASKILIANLPFNYSQVRQWLFNVGEGRDASDTDKLFLMKLESMLKIQVSDYRAIRRMVSDWSQLEKAEQKVSMTRLLLAFRARAPQSEILPMLEKIAKEKNLEIPVEANPEEPIEKSGISLLPLAIGAAVGGGFIAKSLFSLLRNGNKGKKFHEDIQTDTGKNTENQ